MVDSSVKTINFPVVNALANTDSLIALCNTGGPVPNTVLITLQNLLSNSTFKLVLATGSAPANSTANGVPGQVSWDTTNFYVCTGNNVWKRAALASF